jgi:hypothetical protein
MFTHLFLHRRRTPRSTTSVTDPRYRRRPAPFPRMRWY